MIARVLATAALLLAAGCSSTSHASGPTYSTPGEMLARTTSVISCGGGDQAAYMITGALAQNCQTASGEQYLVATFPTPKVAEEDKQYIAGLSSGYAFTYYGNGWRVQAESQATLDVLKSALAK